MKKILLLSLIFFWIPTYSVNSAVGELHCEQDDFSIEFLKYLEEWELKNLYCDCKKREKRALEIYGDKRKFIGELLKLRVDVTKDKQEFEEQGENIEKMFRNRRFIERILIKDYSVDSKLFEYVNKGDFNSHPFICVDYFKE